jgi:hypothetical protein
MEDWSYWGGAIWLTGGFKASQWPIHSIDNPGFIYIIGNTCIADGGRERDFPMPISPLNWIERVWETDREREERERETPQKQTPQSPKTATQLDPTKSWKNKKIITWHIGKNYKKTEQTRMLFGPKQRVHSRIPGHCDWPKLKESFDYVQT